MSQHTQIKGFLFLNLALSRAFVDKYGIVTRLYPQNSNRANFRRPWAPLFDLMLAGSYFYARVSLLNDTL